jgi:perosamine synthetase
MFKETVDYIRQTFNKKEGFIPLHEPKFAGNEKQYLNDCIDSTFVSSVGKYVDDFENKIKEYTGAKYAIATANGTLALHMSLILADVKQGDLVITQPLTFIATCNAISYVGAEPLFIDVEKRTLGLSAEKLQDFFSKKTFTDSNGICIHKETNKKITACVTMHTFGHPAQIGEIANLCKKYGVTLIEDAAESLGSTYKSKQTGRFGVLGTYSFNGNKTITCGGGGIIVTDDENIGKMAKHLTTQAKIPHRWNFEHDHIGYNYRLPNLNAALACAQLEQLDSFIANKRELATLYKGFFANTDIDFVTEPEHSRSNYWLNTVILKNKEERDDFLTFTNNNAVMTRPAWTLMNKLKMFQNSPSENLDNAQWLEDRLVNIPSSVRL